MVKYYYNKYNTETSTKETLVGDGIASNLASGSYSMTYHINQLLGDNSTTVDTLLYSSKTLLGYNIRAEYSSNKFYSDSNFGNFDNKNAYFYSNQNIYKLWTGANDAIKIYALTTVYSRGSLLQSNIVAEDGTYPTNGKHTDGYWYVRGALANNLPIISLNVANNVTLYENDVLAIDGQASDIDNGNIVNVKYQLNGGTTRALATGISNSTNKITFNRSLTFKAGKLYDGETALTDTLAEGTAHQLKVWAEDDQGGKSTEQIRNFYVVPNRPPALTIDEVRPSGIIDSDKFSISGSCSDPDGNDIVVTYKINGGLTKEIYRGKGAVWNFDVSLKDLKVGSNVIVVEVADSYGFKASKTVKLTKDEVKAPLLKSTTRYKVAPPRGSAKGVLLWIQRQKGLDVTASISMALDGEQERFVAMTKTTTAPVFGDVVEDEFTYEADESKTQLTLKLDLTRTNAEVSDAITLISGVLS